MNRLLTGLIWYCRPIEVPFKWNGTPYKLVDTAGMRRRARISDKIEKLMVNDALRAIRYAHLCVLLIDATEEIHKQDLSIARLIEDEGRAIVIGANKWDVVRNKKAASARFLTVYRLHLHNCVLLPVFVSGLL